MKKINLDGLGLAVDENLLSAMYLRDLTRKMRKDCRDQAHIDHI
jgi:hypothetical protein